MGKNVWRQIRRAGLFAISSVLLTTGTAGTSNEIPPAYGAFLHPSAAELSQGQFHSDSDRLVGTYYFYWYDDATKAHIINPGLGTDALTDHPPTLADFSWNSVNWHKKQLLDMESAGIDVALMVFWGAPSEHDTNSQLHWSFSGLGPLVAAREELLKSGHHPPALGLFYDTSTLAYNSWNEHIDLTTDYGRKWFYATVRDFYSCIPAHHWATINGKPVVLMYAADFAKAYDQSFVDYAQAQFPKDFSGRQLYLAPQNSWQVSADSQCAWGGALGLKRAPIAELGPGYDHSAVPGRTPLIVKRENGVFYERNWRKFLRRPSNFVMIETWNEFHEGTDICESLEYGRKYIDLTAKYSRLFKTIWKPLPSIGKYGSASEVEIRLGRTNVETGLVQDQVSDGSTLPAGPENADGIKLASASSLYLYFSVDDSFKRSNRMNVILTVEYLDRGTGTFNAQFDSNDPKAPLAGAYKDTAQVITLTDSKQWRSAKFKFNDARLWNSENGEADLRLHVSAQKICFRRIVLSRP